MSPTSMARAITVIGAALVLAVTIAAGARAAPRAGTGGGGLAAAMLDTGDLPAGFQPDASMTGPLDGERAQALGIDPNQFGSHDALVAAWFSPHSAEEVVETAFDAWTRDNAQAGVAFGASELLKEGAVRQLLLGPAPFDAYGAFIQVNGIRLFVLVLPMARGPYDFGLQAGIDPGAPAAAPRPPAASAVPEVVRG